MEWVVKPTNPESTAKDMVLITYADMLQSECDNLSSLSVLREFCTARLKGAVSASIFCLSIHGPQMMDFQ